MTFDEALSYLLSLGHETLTIKLGLRNTQTLLAALGDPQKRFRAVQIAGTNGKGSSAAMLDAICRAAGIRVGLFTSPHLISIAERVRLHGCDIMPDEFARLTERVKITAEDLQQEGRLQTAPTFFEHVTAIALLAFAEAEVELAILETGLGGRLDSTTAVGADIVAITPIAMDHEKYLGHTLSEIAAEKAAIIRPGVEAVIAPQPGEAGDVVLERAKGCAVNPTLIQDWKIETSPLGNSGRFKVTIQTNHESFGPVDLSLRGRHQVTNAATAVGLAELLRDQGFSISRAAIIQGLATAKHSGRLELWEAKPPILFDGAHNPASVEVFRAYLDEFVTAPITMIFGAMQDKSLAQMASMLFPKAQILILTQIENARAATLEELRAAMPLNYDHERICEAARASEALRLAMALTSADGLICVTGSLHLIGEVQKAITGS